MSEISIPLAERLRPQSLDEFVGQEHILAKGKPLYEAIKQGRPHSMIFWGPPGVGKTTIAYLIAKQTNAKFETLSAVLSGVKDIRAVIERATFNQEQGQATLVFVDEVHRFNKAQQDAFLPHVERGLFTFIGATTENPSFEVNNALLSRAQVYILHALSNDNIQTIIDNALVKLESTVIFPDALKQKLAEYADGDARSALNALEILLADPSVAEITDTFLADTLKNSTRRFDKGGEDFYNQISALHKSVRGSNPDAALYWFARMIDGGCDPLYIARRVIRMATEDIGNADPRALTIALSAWQAQERLGSPEGELAIAQAIAYITVAPKSNAVYLAYKKALKLAKESGSLEVPLHLRNAPTKLMQQLDYGAEYRYDHDEPNAFAAGQTYLPPELLGKAIYKPTERGLEEKISAKLARLKKISKGVKS